MNKSVDGSVEHNVIVPLLPASGAGLIVTVTSAVTDPPPQAFKLYVYVPAASNTGSKNPVPELNAGVHVPPASGVPPN